MIIMITGDFYNIFCDPFLFIKDSFLMQHSHFAFLDWLAVCAHPSLKIFMNSLSVQFIFLAREKPSSSHAFLQLMSEFLFQIVVSTDFWMSHVYCLTLTSSLLQWLGESSNLSLSLYIYIYIYIYIHTHTDIHIYICTHINTHTHTHIYIYIYIYI